jgi:hypothetical protein
MTVQILNSILAFAILGYVQIFHNLGARCFRAREMRIYIAHEYRHALRPVAQLRRAQLPGLRAAA